MKHLQKVIVWALLGPVLIVAIWIRIQGVSTIPDGQFTGNDPYLYYWQAQIVSTQGRLPARDMHRWLPLGRDLEQTLNAYSYGLAYTHKAVTLIFRGVSLYQITLLAPVICFVIGLGILCLFLHRIFGLLFSSIVGVLLATLPGVIDRSTAGFSDRDSWCFLIGVLAITTYLASLQAQSSRCNFFFFLSVVGLVVVLIFIAGRRNEKPKHELTYVAMGTWFLLWVTLSREALRYDFFIGVSISFFTAELICFGASVLIGKLKHTRLLNDDFRRRMPQSLLKASLACIMLAVLMFWRPAGEHAKRSLHAATQMRPAMPGSTPVGKMFQWMKTELPYTSVVAARWNYGSQLNVLGGVKTIVDQDHYIQHWIHLYEKHVYNATDAREALEFLKTHRVTHLMVAQTQPPEVFLQGTESNAFVPVYPTNAFEESFVKVWEIHYPSDIKANLKYLATEPEK